MIIDKLKKYLNFQSGFFLEVGAYDGVFQSNTYHLERELNWTGILIEPVFKAYLQCIKNRQKSIVLNCLLTSYSDYKKKKYSFGDFDAYSKMSKRWGGHPAGGGPMSSVLSFKKNGDIKRLFEKIRRNYSFVPVLNFPMQIILDEFSINKIDFFSLDVEGHEYEVLNGINFEKVKIKYISAEIRTSEEKKVFDYLFSKGFKLIERLTNYNIKDNPDWDGLHNDFFFENKL
jgi:hypothetical protein